MFTDDAGDVNADGVPDFLVGSWGASSNGYKKNGAAAVYSGVDGSIIYEWTGVGNGANMGRAVCRVDDVNGDGHAEVAVGAWGTSSNGLNQNGVIHIYDGASGLAMHSIEGTFEEATFGRFLRNAGDVDSDGVKDIIAGAYHANPNGMVDAGAAYVISGLTGGIIWEKFGHAPGDGFGRSVSGVGDVDQDGFDDFMVGAWWTDHGNVDAGSAYLYSGKTGAEIHRYDGTSVFEGFGRGVSGGGDINADGIPDFIVGSYLADVGGLTDCGSVFVYSGADGHLLHRFNGENRNESLGWFVNGPADLNGDGHAEIFAGGYQADALGLNGSGRVYLWSGKTGASLERFLGHQVEGALGRSVSNVGDVDQDGIPDLIIGASNMHHGALISAGSVYVFVSGTGPDSDQDGLSDAVEALRGSDPADMDTDDDGVLDGEEASPWLGSPVLSDSDQDGILDGTERGVVTASVDTDLAIFVPDADPSTNTYPAVADSDSGGLSDGAEDVNHNGMVDGVETDPRDPQDDFVSSLTVVGPLVAGQACLLQVDGGVDSAITFFVCSLQGAGPTALSKYGVTLELSIPMLLLGSSVMDSSLSASLSVDVPVGTQGMQIWFDAAVTPPTQMVYKATGGLALVVQ